MPYSEAQKRATNKYKEKAYKRIPLDVPVAEYDALKAYCKQAGESVNGFIRRIIKENIS